MGTQSQRSCRNAGKSATQNLANSLSYPWLSIIAHKFGNHCASFACSASALLFHGLRPDEKFIASFAARYTVDRIERSYMVASTSRRLEKLSLRGLSTVSDNTEEGNLREDSIARNLARQECEVEKKCIVLLQNGFSAS